MPKLQQRKIYIAGYSHVFLQHQLSFYLKLKRFLISTFLLADFRQRFTTPTHNIRNISFPISVYPFGKTSPSKCLRTLKRSVVKLHRFSIVDIYFILLQSKHLNCFSVFYLEGFILSLISPWSHILVCLLNSKHIKPS